MGTAITTLVTSCHPITLKISEVDHYNDQRVPVPPVSLLVRLHILSEPDPSRLHQGLPPILVPTFTSIMNRRQQYRPTGSTRASTVSLAETVTRSSLPNTSPQKSAPTPALRNRPPGQRPKDNNNNALSQSNKVRPFLRVKK